MSRLAVALFLVGACHKGQVTHEKAASPSASNIDSGNDDKEAPKAVEEPTAAEEPAVEPRVPRKHIAHHGKVEQPEAASEKKPEPAASPASAYGVSPGSDWKAERHDKQITVFSRDDRKVAGREIRVFAEVNAPPSKVFDVVTDFLNYPKFMPYTREEKILQHPSSTELRVYSVVAPPATAWRDCVANITLTRGSSQNGGVFRSEWVAFPSGAPLRPGVVRIQLNTGYWLLEPTDAGNKTHVTYEIVTNPGGNIPRWIVDASAAKGIPALIRAVSDRAGAKPG